MLTIELEHTGVLFKGVRNDPPPGLKPSHLASLQKQGGRGGRAFAVIIYLFSTSRFWIFLS